MSLFTKQDVLALDAISDTICFPQLVTGDWLALDRMNGNVEPRPSIHGFYDFVSENQISIPSQAKITILEKHGKRNVHNFKEVVSLLTKIFPSIKVEVLDIAKLEGQSQVNALADTTLLISPAGGICTAAPLLRPGSTLLVYGFYDTNKNASREYEGHLFSHYTHFSVVVFPIKYSEVITKGCPMPEGDLQLIHHGTYVYCHFNVNLDRLEKMTKFIVRNWYLYYHNSLFQ